MATSAFYQFLSKLLHVHSTPGKQSTKVLDMLQILNKERQSLLVSFRVTVAANFVIFLLGKVFPEFKQQQLYFCALPSKQIHSQIQQQKP